MNKGELKKLIKNNLEDAVFINMSFIDIENIPVCYALGYMYISDINYKRYKLTNANRLDLTNHMTYECINISPAKFNKLKIIAHNRLTPLNTNNYIKDSIDGKIFYKNTDIIVDGFLMSFTENITKSNISSIDNINLTENTDTEVILDQFHKNINNLFKRFCSISKMINRVKIYIKESSYKYLLDRVLDYDVKSEIELLKIIFIDNYLDIDVSNHLKYTPYFKPLSNYECIESHINYLQYMKGEIIKCNKIEMIKVY